MSKPTVIYFGASRGVAFYSYKTLASLRPDLHHILLLRSVSRFQSSEEYKTLPEDLKSSTRSTFVEGDAHNEANIRDILKTSSTNGHELVAIVSSIGMTPPSDTIGTIKALVRGFKLDPPDVCCRGFLILMTELSKIYSSLPTKPKLVLVSSMGMGTKAHDCLALGLGAMYSFLLTDPHKDKIGMELIMDKCMMPSTSKTLPRFFPSEAEVPPNILPLATYAGLPAAFIPQEDVCVPRFALLSDGEENGWGKYRVIQEGPGKDESKGKKLYSLSRKDAGGFIGELLSGNNEEVNRWWGCQPVIGY